MRKIGEERSVGQELRGMRVTGDWQKIMAHTSL
jgi:hypothetical protein